MSLKSCKKSETVNLYEYEVTVDAETFEKAVAQTYRREVKQIALPGFRKGKAPRHMIEKMYGPEVFYDGAVKSIIQDGSVIYKAIEESGVDFVSIPTESLEVVSVGKEGLEIKFNVVAKPEVEIENYKGIEAPKLSTEVTEKDLEEELARAQERNSRMVPVEDRAAALNDVVVIDYEGTVDGVPFEGGKAEKYNLTLGSNQFIPGFEDQIVGHNVDDVFDVQVTFPEDYHAEELKGKAAVFKVTLHEIRKKELPELDDDFAKDQDFDTLEEYKENLKKEISERKTRVAEDDFKNKLIDKLLELMKAEVPEVMYEQSIDNSLREFEYRLSSQGMNMDMYMKYTGMDVENMRKSFRPQAERQVKLRLALEKIAALENIVPTQEDIEAEYEKIAKAYNMETDKIKNMIPEKELIKDIAVEKAMGIVEETAVPTTAEETAE